MKKINYVFDVSERNNEILDSILEPSNAIKMYDKDLEKILSSCNHYTIFSKELSNIIDKNQTRLLNLNFICLSDEFNKFDQKKIIATIEYETLPKWYDVFSYAEKILKENNIDY